MNTKTEKPKYFGTKTEKPIYKLAKTAKPKIPMLPSSSIDPFDRPVAFERTARKWSFERIWRPNYDLSAHASLVLKPISSVDNQLFSLSAR